MTFRIILQLFYRRRISDQQFLSGSLLGLSETGSSDDLPIFEQYVNAEKSKIVVACLTAGCTKIFKEKVSAAKERPELEDKFS